MHSVYRLFRFSRALKSHVAAVALVAFAGCGVTGLRVWGPGGSTGDGFEVEEIRDVAYCTGPKADARHRLDLFLPRGVKDYPVVLLVHGGTWMMGDNRCCGLYSSVGHFLARHGIGAVLPNYRLSPFVKHPEHVKDVARAFAWTRTHIGKHGGDPARLFLAGHSAGGHLVSLLATDATYLAAERFRTDDIKGVITTSGVYRIPPGKLSVTLGGKTPTSFRFEQMSPLRGPCKQGECLLEWPAIPVTFNLFGLAFGDDLHEREQASPLAHVCPGLPPFLIVSAEKDLPLLPDMADDFHHALQQAGVDSMLLKVPGRNHNSVFFQAIEPDDPVARAMVDFIQRNKGKGASMERGRPPSTRPMPPRRAGVRPRR